MEPDTKRGAAMTRTLRRLGVLVLAAMLLAAATRDGQAQGRRRTTFDGVSVVANPVVQKQLTLGQYAYNIAVLGKALQRVPPYAFANNPYANNPYGYNPYLAGGSPLSPALNPYTLSTLGGTGTGGYPSLSTSPYGALGGNYSMSTVPGTGGGYDNPYGYPPYTYIPPAAATLMGAASLTSASGK